MTKTCTILSASVLILAAGQSGCSRSNESQTAVREAARTFEMVAAGNADSSPTIASNAYRQAETISAQYAGSEDGYTQAAALGVAQAKIGQAALASQEASKAEGAAIHRQRIIRGYINEWLTMSAIAQAANTFDPTDGLKELAALITLRQEDIVTYRTQKDDIESQIAQLESMIADLEAKAKAQRDAGAEIELQIPDVSATKGAELAERVREHTLRGDQYGLEAVRVKGRVEQLRPAAEEFALNVAKAKVQIELLDDAREELQERERLSNADAAQARAEAQTARDAIIKLANELDSFRSSEVEAANAKAISLARGAITATRDANTTLPSLAALTKASALQTLGECLARKSAGHGQAAVIYNTIAETGIPGDWASKAEHERNEQQSIHEEAMQAYQDAAAALRSSRIRGEVADKIEAAAARLDTLGGLEPEPEYTDGYNNEDEYTNESDDEDNELTDSDDG